MENRICFFSFELIDRRLRNLSNSSTWSDIACRGRNSTSGMKWLTRHQLQKYSRSIPLIKNQSYCICNQITATQREDAVTYLTSCRGSSNPTLIEQLHRAISDLDGHYEILVFRCPISMGGRAGKGFEYNIFVRTHITLD